MTTQPFSVRFFNSARVKWPLNGCVNERRSLPLKTEYAEVYPLFFERLFTSIVRDDDLATAWEECASASITMLEVAIRNENCTLLYRKFESVFETRNPNPLK